MIREILDIFKNTSPAELAGDLIGAISIFIAAPALAIFIAVIFAQ